MSRLLSADFSKLKNTNNRESLEYKLIRLFIS